MHALTCTCHHLLGFIRFHVAIVLSGDFLHVGLSATSLLGIKGVGIVLKNDWLQEDTRKDRLWKTDLKKKKGILFDSNLQNYMKCVPSEWIQ